MVICLERGADLHTAQLIHCHSLSVASVKSRLVLPFWYRLTRVVPDKGPLNVCVCVNAILMRCSGILRMTVPLEKWQQLLSFERSVKIYQIEERAVVKFLFVNTIFCKIRQ